MSWRILSPWRLGPVREESVRVGWRMAGGEGCMAMEEIFNWTGPTRIGESKHSA